jgi:FADH2 O2-dependent halogenase
VDPLFSRGLISSIESIDSVCETLLEALKDDDFTEDRFQETERQEKRVLSFTDRVVHGAYVSWDDFEMWNVWVRLWAIGAHVIESHLGSILAMGKASKVKVIDEPLVSMYEDPGYKQYFNDSYAIITRYENDEITSKQAARELEARLQAYEFRIPLRGQVQGQEWAMKNPLVRDIFLGDMERHERWVSGRIDDHLAPPALVG